MASQAHLPDFWYEIHHEFAILDFECPPDHISGLLGIQPSTSWKRGELIEHKPGRVYRASGWIYETKVVQTNTVAKNNGAHLPSLELLIETVYSVRYRLNEIPVAPRFSVATIIFADTFNASTHISPKIMRLLAESNVEYIVDSYLGMSK